MIQALEEAGFHNARTCEFFDSFRGTNKENVARKFAVQGANFIAYKKGLDDSRSDHAISA